MQSQGAQILREAWRRHFTFLKNATKVDFDGRDGLSLRLVNTGSERSELMVSSRRLSVDPTGKRCTS